MPKTYNTFTNASTGDVLTATTFNNVLTNVGNYRVPPMCSLNLTGLSITSAGLTVGSGGASGTWTEEFDTDDMRNPSVSPERITATTAGVYVVTANLFASSGISERNIQILKNGTAVAIQTLSAGSSYFAETSVSVITSCAANDYLTVQAFSVTTRTYSVRFGAVWLGQVA